MERRGQALIAAVDNYIVLRDVHTAFIRNIKHNIEWMPVYTKWMRFSKTNTKKNEQNICKKRIQPNIK